jgi:small subunit ribosomal protein S1
MPASYDEQGNYEYPEGFDPETGEWLPGYEKQREEWEHQYAEARARFEAHRRQVEESRKADEEEAVAAEPEGAAPAVGPGGPAGPGGPRGARGARGGSRPATGTPGAVTSSSTPGPASTGTLASDEALAALREKLSGGQS